MQSRALADLVRYILNELHVARSVCQPAVAKQK